MPPRKKTVKPSAPRLEDPLDFPLTRPGVIVKPRVPFFARPPVIVALLGTMLLCALYLWVAQPTQPNQPPQTPSLPSTQYPPEQANDQKPSEDPIARVSHLILVNEDETPEVFTVSDAAAFRTQAPQAGPVQEGDKVLTWSDKTVVYSPSEDKLIAVYPTVPPAPPEPEQEATVEIRNASGINGAASKLKKALTDAGLVVSRVGDAATRQADTIIVDLSNGEFPKALAKLASLSLGTSGPMPEGEPNSTAKILILIGK